MKVVRERPTNDWLVCCGTRTPGYPGLDQTRFEVVVSPNAHLTRGHITLPPPKSQPFYTEYAERSTAQTGEVITGMLNA